MTKKKCEKKLYQIIYKAKEGIYTQDDNYFTESKLIVAGIFEKKDQFEFLHVFEYPSLKPVTKADVRVY